MNHKWVNTGKKKNATTDVCTFCNCIRFTQLENQRHFTSYMPDGGNTWLRTAPVCIDKINPEFDFNAKGVTV